MGRHLGATITLWLSRLGNLDPEFSVPKKLEGLFSPPQPPDQTLDLTFNRIANLSGGPSTSSVYDDLTCTCRSADGFTLKWKRDACIPSMRSDCWTNQTALEELVKLSAVAAAMPCRRKDASWQQCVSGVVFGPTIKQPKSRRPAPTSSHAAIVKHPGHHGDMQDKAHILREGGYGINPPSVLH